MKSSLSSAAPKAVLYERYQIPYLLFCWALILAGIANAVLPSDWESTLQRHVATLSWSYVLKFPALLITGWGSASWRFVASLLPAELTQTEKAALLTFLSFPAYFILWPVVWGTAEVLVTQGGSWAWHKARALTWTLFLGPYYATRVVHRSSVGELAAVAAVVAAVAVAAQSPGMRAVPGRTFRSARDFFDQRWQHQYHYQQQQQQQGGYRHRTGQQGHNHHHRPPFAEPPVPLSQHYRTLGIPEGTPEKEIKHEYHRLSMLYHPDKTGGDKEKEQKFLEIQNAYEQVMQSFEAGKRAQSPVDADP